MSTVIQDQSWLNSRGAKLIVDGKAGPATRKAMIEVFRNGSAPAATGTEIATMAAVSRLKLRAMKAVARVESSGTGWDESGLLSCLYERHYLFRRIGLAWGMYSSATPGGYTVDADGDGINDSWEKLADASCRFGMQKVFECASFGRFQIMGAHWKALNYTSAPDFVWELSRTEVGHYAAFVRFILANNLAEALNQVDGNPENCRAIASGYNGKSYAANGYHQKIAAAWKAVG